MGSIYNETVVITGYPRVIVKSAREKAVEIFGDIVTDVVNSKVNGEATFMVVSSGSKTGWDLAEEHKESIREFKKWLKEQGIYEYYKEKGYEPVELNIGEKVIANSIDVKNEDGTVSTFYDDIEGNFEDYLDIVELGYGVDIYGERSSQVKYNREEEIEEE